MRSLSAQDGNAWIHNADLEYDGRFPHFRIDASVIDTLQVPNDRSAMGLGYLCVLPVAGTGAFKGGLIRLQGEWEQLSGLGNFGEVLLGGLLEGLGASFFADGPNTILFEKEDFENCCAIWITAVILGIDAFFVPADGGALFKVSHESILEIVCSTKQLAETLHAHFHSYRKEADRLSMRN